MPLDSLDRIEHTGYEIESCPSLIGSNKQNRTKTRSFRKHLITKFNKIFPSLNFKKIPPTVKYNSHIITHNKI